MTSRVDHISRRKTLLGKSLPALIYVVNYLLWIVTAVQIQAWDLLWLGVFPLPALALYVVRIRKQKT